jgi:DNA-binding CsgD family transcriptional regulator
MNEEFRRYSLFFKFIKTFTSVGFQDIDRHDPLVLELEEMMKINNQFFLIFDMLRMKVLFTSQGSLQLLGINPDDLNPFHFKEATHPDDLKRNELGVAKLFKSAHEIFVEKQGELLISTNFRFRNITGNYVNQLVQCYLFYSPLPNDTVYMVNINTDIEWSKKLRNNFHYYIGKKMSNFRYPDEKLLQIGHSLTDREFQIIRLVQAGLSSDQIAERLFLSRHTVNKHRKNILDKTGKAHISELIYDLHEQGLL